MKGGNVNCAGLTRAAESHPAYDTHTKSPDISRFFHLPIRNVKCLLMKQNSTICYVCVSKYLGGGWGQCSCAVSLTCQTDHHREPLGFLGGLGPYTCNSQEKLVSWCFSCSLEKCLGIPQLTGVQYCTSNIVSQYFSLALSADSL